MGPAAVRGPAPDRPPVAGGAGAPVRRSRLATGVRLALALVITAGFAVVVGRRLDLAELLTTLRGLGAPRVALGLGVISLTVLLRALRLCVCLGERPGLALMSASVVHNALVALIPAKMGEFALPALLARLRGTDPLRGLGILAILRVFDLLALVAVGGAAAGLAYSGAQSAPMASPVFAAASLVALAGLALASRLGGLLARWTARPSGRWMKRDLPARVLSALSTLQGRAATRLALLSLAIWLSLFTSLYLFAAGIGGPASWSHVAVEATAGSLAFALPVNGVANLGPFQAAWVGAAATLDEPGDLALLRSLVAHGAVLLTTLVLALLAGWVLLRALSRQR